MKLCELPSPSVFKFTYKDGTFIRYGDDNFQSTDRKDKFPYRVTENNKGLEVTQLNTEYSLEIATVDTIPYGVVFTIRNCPNGSTWFKVNGGPHGDAIISSDDYTMHKLEKKCDDVIVLPVIQIFNIIDTKLIEFKTKLKVREVITLKPTKVV